jgi:hypothetical protein
MAEFAAGNQPGVSQCPQQPRGICPRRDPNRSCWLVITSECLADRACALSELCALGLAADRVHNGAVPDQIPLGKPQRIDGDARFLANQCHQAAVILLSGPDWELLPESAIPDAQSIVGMLAGPTGFLVFGSALDAPAIWSSADGRVWSRLSLSLTGGP